MCAQPASQLPDTLHMIQFRTVSWQEFEPYKTVMFFQPGLKHIRMMPSRIIQNNNHLTTRAPVTKENFHESLEGFGVEAFRPACNEQAILGANGAKHPDTLAGWSMKHNRVHTPRWHPHLATRTALPQVQFIHKPQVKIISFGQTPEFFYISPAPPGWHGQSPGGVCDNEIQTGGTASDIVAP